MFTVNNTLDVPKCKAMARTFPLAVAGNVTGYAFNAATAVFSMNYTLAALPAYAPTRIYVGTQLWYPAGVQVAVVSNPPNVVTWSLEPHEPGEHVRTTEAAPVPFRYAYLHIVPASPGVGDGASIRVTVWPQSLRSE